MLGVERGVQVMEPEVMEPSVKFRFIWSVDGTQLSQCSSNKGIYSAEFKTVHNNIGFKWYLAMTQREKMDGKECPMEKEPTNYIGVCLCLSGKKEALCSSVPVKSTFFVEVGREHLNESRLGQHNHDFGRGLGLANFLPWSVPELRNLALLSPGDKLSMGVILEIQETVFQWKEFYQQMEKEEASSQPSRFLSLLFEKVRSWEGAPAKEERNGEKYLDLSILTSDKRIIKCHGVVLSERNKYFRALLQSDSKENHENKVTVTFDCKTMMEILHYIYTDSVSLTFHEQEIYPILDGANMYGINPLKLICERSLIQEMHSSNCVELLILADRYDLKILREMGINVMSENLLTVWNLEEKKKMDDKLWEEALAASEMRLRVAKIQ